MSESSFSKIARFIRDIGLDLEFRPIDTPTFLPGIHIENGVVQADPEKLLYPGDLLHEAGHLALLPSEERKKITGNVEPGDNKQNSLEMGVICWTWAAILHLDIDPTVVFHKAGYHGASNYYIQMFSTGQFIGLPVLQWMELCKHQSDTSDLEPFPHMVKWIRD